MKLSHERPIAFFDIESTGTNVSTDRIVEISILKRLPNGKEEVRTYRINPEIPIPAVTSEIHGIYDDDIKDEPTFKDIAAVLFLYLQDCDLAGYNSNKFDIPILIEEFKRAGYDFDVMDRNLIDVQNIFHRLEQRTLAAAYQFYCNKSLENAHSAEADIRATYEVLLAQLERYDELKGDPKFLDEFSRRHNHVDLLGRFVYDDKRTVRFNFGKHKGKTVAEVLEKEPGYYGWMMHGEFPSDTKKVLKRERDKLPKK